LHQAIAEPHVAGILVLGEGPCDLGDPAWPFIEHISGTEATQ
jgi:hypothetical protein